MGSSKWQALNGNTIVCPGTSLWRWVAGQGPRLGQAADTRLVLTSDTVLPCSSTVGTLLKHETQASPMSLMGTVWSQGYFKSAWDLDHHSKIKPPSPPPLLWFVYFCFLSWGWPVEVFWSWAVCLGLLSLCNGTQHLCCHCTCEFSKVISDAEDRPWLNGKE